VAEPVRVEVVYATGIKMPNLTKVKARLNDVKRKLYYDKDTVIKFFDINDPLLELEKGWHMPVRPYSNMALSAEYFEVFVAENDDINLEDVIPFTSAIEINGERFALKRYERPRGLTKQWYLRVDSSGEKV
jgi:hypothetical protein